MFYFLFISSIDHKYLPLRNILILRRSYRLCLFHYNIFFMQLLVDIIRWKCFYATAVSCLALTSSFTYKGRYLLLGLNLKKSSIYLSKAVLYKVMCSFSDVHRLHQQGEKTSLQMCQQKKTLKTTSQILDS